MVPGKICLSGGRTIDRSFKRGKSIDLYLNGRKYSLLKSQGLKKIFTIFFFPLPYATKLWFT
jgi:hypothetical protein